MEMDVLMIRLDKYLADMGVGTRSEVKKYIRQGLVFIDGIPAVKPEEKVDPDRQTVTCAGKQISYVNFAYYMLNKPAGIVSATRDFRDRTVLDLIQDAARKDLFPVGRLDRDTEGLLLITNDGALAHDLLSPKKHVDKVYYAKIDGCVNADDIRRFREGIEIGNGEKARPAVLEILSAEDVSEIRLTIREGKFHQVKRMFHTVGKEVLYLKRLSMGSLVLDEALQPGEYRTLTEEEICSLKAAADSGHKER